MYRIRYSPTVPTAVTTGILSPGFQLGIPHTTGVVISTGIFTPTTVPVTTVVPIDTASIGDTTTTISLSPSIAGVTTIRVSGEVHRPVYTLEQLAPDTYYYDPIENTVTLQTTIPFYPNTAIEIVGSEERISTDIVEAPAFVKEYGLSGDFSITRSFESHPNASFSVVTDAAGVAKIRSLFSDYNHKFVFYGIPFRCNTTNTKIQPLNIAPFGEYEISISLEGWYSKLLGEKVFLRKDSGVTTTDSTGTIDPACNKDQSKPPSSVSIGLGGSTFSPTNPNNLSISVATIASKAGFSYTGQSYYYEYPKDTPRDTTIDFNSAIGDKARISGNYIFYSNEMGVTTRNWAGVDKTTVLNTDILEPITESNNVRPVEYNVVRIDWNQGIPESEPSSDESTTDNSRPKWEYKPPKIYTITTGDPNPTQPPINHSIVTTLDLVFDRSGDRKTKIETTYEGSSILRQTTTIYGYKYLGSDIYNSNTGALFGAAGSLWGAIEKTTTEYLYDGRTGYLLGTDSSGWKCCRYNSETDAIESVSLDTGDSTDAAIRNTYNFIQIPKLARTRYVLRQYSDYYKDSDPFDPYVPYQDCDAAGQLVTKYTKDPTAIPSLFIGEELSESYCFSRMPNPDSSDFTSGSGTVKPPDLTTGEENKTVTKIKIFHSKNTRKDTLLGFTDSGALLLDNMIGDINNPRTEDTYLSYIKEFSAQDGGFSNSTENTREEESGGKPSQGTTKPLPYVPKNAEEPEPDYSTTGVISRGGLLTSKSSNNNTPPKTEYKYILTTSPYSPYEAEQSSISCSATSEAAALVYAITQLHIDDMQNNLQTSVSTFFNPYLEEGTRYYFDFAGEYFPRRIISNTSKLVIEGLDTEGSPVCHGTTNLSLGNDCTTPVTIAKLPLPNTTVPGDATNTSDETTRFITTNIGFELGALLNGSISSRGS
jgi:hypothetical protein